MDPVLLSRLQFAAATAFHFIFVPLTLGLSILIAIMETWYVRTGNETYKRMAKFWGKLFLINFALGVVTGITLEFQFGTNWSRYSEYVGDIFGSLLAIEATAAFFLESTFIAVWTFGWEKLSAKAHLACIWIVAFAGNLSAIWIIIANGFMQNPMGYVERNGRLELENFFTVIGNGFAWQQFFHTIFAALLVGAFFVMGISAYHLLKKKEVDFFTKSFRFGLYAGLIASILIVVQGHHHGNAVAELQPAKLAAMESHWVTQKNAPMYLLVVPDEANDRNAVEMFGIPSLLSILAFSNPDAEVKGLNDFPKEDRPPVLITFLSFRAMVGLGTLFPILCILGWLFRNNLTEKGWYLKVMLLSIPLPYIATEAGWMVAEVGRQPWIVYGLMRTSQAVSPVDTGQVLFSLVFMTLLYTFLGAAGIWLMAKYAKKGPEGEAA